MEDTRLMFKYALQIQKIQPGAGVCVCISTYFYYMSATI